MIVLVMALLFAGIIGSALRLQDASRAGRLSDGTGSDGRRDASALRHGIVTPTLLFCIGPLTIVGSLSDGLGRGADQLLVSPSSTASLRSRSRRARRRVLLSAGMVAIIQGALTLAGFLLVTSCPAPYVDIITATGGVILLAWRSVCWVSSRSRGRAAACPGPRAAVLLGVALVF